MKIFFDNQGKKNNYPLDNSLFQAGHNCFSGFNLLKSIFSNQADLSEEAKLHFVEKTTDKLLKVIVKTVKGEGPLKNYGDD